MKTIIVLSREYSDRSGYTVMKAYSKKKQNEANSDLLMMKELNDDFNYRLTEIPISE